MHIPALQASSEPVVFKFNNSAPHANVSAPCRSFADQVCDEWTGRAITTLTHEMEFGKRLVILAKAVKQ